MTILSYASTAYTVCICYSLTCYSFQAMYCELIQLCVKFNSMQKSTVNPFNVRSQQNHLFAILSNVIDAFMIEM